MRQPDFNDPLLIERYLRNALTPEEEAAFEEHYLANPELLDELEISDRLRQGFKDIATVDSQREPARPKPGIMSWLATPQYATAATVLLLMSVVFSGMLYQRVDQLPDPSLATDFTDTRIVPLFAVRGAPDDRTVIEVASGEQLVLLVDPGPAPYADFRAEVFREDGDDTTAAVWTGEALLPGYQGMLVLAIPGDRLATGNYQVRIAGRRDGLPPGGELEAVSEQTFRIGSGR
jgi:hypothetical protein